MLLFYHSTDGATAVSPSDLLQTDMSDKVITHMVLPKMADNSTVKFYKVAKRSEVG